MQFAYRRMTFAITFYVHPTVVNKVVQMVVQGSYFIKKRESAMLAVVARKVKSKPTRLEWVIVVGGGKEMWLGKDTSFKQ